MEKEFLLSLGQISDEVAQAILQQHTEELDRAAREHESAMSRLRLESRLQAAIARERGRNATAITALLDTQALEQADETQVTEAVRKLKQEHGYLFEAPMPPAFADGAGVTAPVLPGPASLAEALRERFGRK